jgi:hypothetical protein
MEHIPDVLMNMTQHDKILHRLYHSNKYKLEYFKQANWELEWINTAKELLHMQFNWSYHKGSSASSIHLSASAASAAQEHHFRVKSQDQIHIVDSGVNARESII